MAYTITIDEVVNNVVVTPPAGNDITVSTSNYPIEINYNGILIETEGIAENGLPTGGTVGQFLRKSSSTNYDAGWVNITDVNTTYGISAETATGGANLRLTGSDATVDNVTIAAGTNITVTRTDANTITIAGTGVTDIVQDTTPQLGGALDVNGQIITSVSNGNIVLEPNGTGDVQLNTDTVRVGDLNTTAVITTNGTGTLRFNTNNNTTYPRVNLDNANTRIDLETAGANYLSFNKQDFDLASNIGMWAETTSLRFVGGGSTFLSFNDPSGSANQVQLSSPGTSTVVITGGTSATINGGSSGGTITVGGTTNSNISITPNGTGDVQLNADTVRVGDSNAAATITSNGTGNLTINTNSGTNSGTIVINQGANGNIAITPNGTGSVVLDGLSYPQSDGTAGQVLKTNGSGVLSWVDKQDPTIVNDSQPAVQSTGQHWYRPMTGALYTARNNAWEPINDDGFF